MTLHLYVRIKFRNFGITFGEVRRQFELSFDGGTLHVKGVSINVPDTATTVFDSNGCQVKAW